MKFIILAILVTTVMAIREMVKNSSPVCSIMTIKEFDRAKKCCSILMDRSDYESVDNSMDEIKMVHLDKVLYVIIDPAPFIKGWWHTSQFTSVELVDSVMCYSGIKQIYDMIIPRIKDTVDRTLICTEDIICFCGHSRGGGLASMMALEYRMRNPTLTNRIELITFGSAPSITLESLKIVPTEFLNNSLNLYLDGDNITRLIEYTYGVVGKRVVLDPVEKNQPITDLFTLHRSNSYWLVIQRLDQLVYPVEEVYPAIE